MQKRRFSRGQTLIIVALSLVALIGLVALAVDGGSTFVQRRHVQNGADSAALGAVALFQQAAFATCNPAPCHPFYAITNSQAFSTTDQLVQANKGDVLGPAAYTTNLDYHFINQAPDCNLPGARASRDPGCYRASSYYNSSDVVPAFVDGVLVTASVNNPTVFARAINIQTLAVSAEAAARLYPTCQVAPIQGPSLPFTRFWPSLDAEINDPNNGNSLCHPFSFWSSTADVSNFKDLIAFNTHTFYTNTSTSVITQELTAFDLRNGPPPPPSDINHAGLSSHNAPSSGDCTTLTPQYCADMRGSADPQSPQKDLEDWIFWNWAGTLSISSTYPLNTETWHPANRTNYGGQCGPNNPWSGPCTQATQDQPGDWVETYSAANLNLGNNIQLSVHDLAIRDGHTDGFSGPPLNWGPYVDKIIYVWGPDPATFPSVTPLDRTTAQTHADVNIPNNSCVYPNNDPRCVYVGWEDVTLSRAGNNPYGPYCAGDYNSNGANGNTCGNENARVDRVRLTHAYVFRFYANLQGNYGAQPAPSCSTSLPNAGSSAWGLFRSEYTPPGGGGTCGWRPGVGIYGGLVEP